MVWPASALPLWPRTPANSLDGSPSSPCGVLPCVATSGRWSGCRWSLATPRLPAQGLGLCPSRVVRWGRAVLVSRHPRLVRGMGPAVDSPATCIQLSIARRLLPRVRVGGHTCVVTSLASPYRGRGFPVTRPHQCGLPSTYPASRCRVSACLQTPEQQHQNRRRQHEENQHRVSPVVGRGRGVDCPTPRPFPVRVMPPRVPPSPPLPPRSAPPCARVGVRPWSWGLPPSPRGARA